MVKVDKANRNKTIDFSLEEGVECFNRCIDEKTEFSIHNILDKTINGDTFKIMEKLPKKFIDLLIVDPPYNLSKDYNGSKFKKTDNKSYGEYLQLTTSLILFRPHI